LTDTIIGIISGAIPTATAIANKNASNQFPLKIPFNKKTAGTITIMNFKIKETNCFSSLLKSETWSFFIQVYCDAPQISIFAGVEH